MAVSLLDLFLFLAGLAVLLPLLLPFSPLTADLVLLSRDKVVAIHRWRRSLWTVGLAALGLVLARSALGAADPVWTVIVAATGGVLGLFFWSGYVPLIMTPPEGQRWLSASEADALLAPGTHVLGLKDGDASRAYPRDFLARPHYIYDEVHGRPLLISYCILCNSAMAFEAELDGRQLELRSLTAINNNIIYYEPARGNYIQQLDGAVFAGPDTGRQLRPLALVMTTWEQWRDLHPDTKVVYAPPHTLRDRLVDGMLRRLIPLEKLARRQAPWHRLEKNPDTRLPAMARVLGVEHNGERCAFPLEVVRVEAPLQTTVGGEPMVVLFDPSHDTGSVFRRRANGQVLDFQAATGEGADIVARDQQTGSLWDMHGQARSGPMAGIALSEVPHYNKLFWFAWSHFKPDTRIHQGEEKGAGLAV